MRLESIRLVNWRSFLACDIDLSANTTVVIGQNTAGKTALLNAFVWGLYEQTTPGFYKPDDLCNHQAKHKLGEGEQTKTVVQVTFLHGEGQAECKYEARRSLTVTRTGPGIDEFDQGKAQFELNIHPTGPAGNSRQASGEEAEQKIRAIIPASLNPYFFFPAENIGLSIGAPDARAASVKDAASVLLGLKRYEVADAAVKEALGLPKLKEKVSNDLDIRKAQERKDHARKQHKEARADFAELIENIGRVKLLQKAAEQAANRAEDEKVLIEERNSIQQEYEQAQRDAVAATARQRKALNEECFNLFGAGGLKHAQQVLDKATSDGKIPPKVTAGLLEDLIANAETCICGQPITDTALSALRELRRGIVEDIVAESASNIRARVAEIHTQLSARQDENAPQAVLRAANDAIADAHLSMATWRSKLDEFHADNPAVGGDAGSNPLNAFIQHSRTLEKLERDQNDLRAHVDTWFRKRREADNQYNKLKKRRGQADEVSNARGHLTRIEQAVEDIQAELSDGARRDLERAINTIASEVLLRDYTIHLTENFEIETRQNGVEVGGSSSDQSWVTFAFVGAISGLSAAYDKIIDNMDEAGNIKLELGTGYPLVLDAPFSPFGKEYAAEFAERLPGLAPQSVLIVREDQLVHLEPILDAGADKTRAYLMCLHGPPTVDKQEITWRNGFKHAYVKPSDDPNNIRTELEELPL